MSSPITQKRKKTLAAVAAVVVFLLLAACLVAAYGNPQWHPKLYAWQAAKTPDGQLDPGPSFTGTWKNWDREGRLASVFSYAEGKRNGPYEVFTQDGETLSKGQYKNGELDGLQIVNQEGGSRTEIPYEDGKRSGVEKTFYPNGEIAVEAPWTDGEQDGSVTFYYENGSVQSTLPFYRGKREGVHQTFFDNGARQGAENYRGDMLNGVSEFWRQDGSPDMTLAYRDDKLDGIQIWHHPNGEKAREIGMSMGLPDGRWREWDENGKLIVDEDYELGELKKKPGEQQDAGGAGDANAAKGGENAK